MLFDDLIEKHVGSFGKFQILMLCVLGFEELFMSLHVIAPIFIAYTPKNYWCKHPQLDNDTVFGNCSLQDRLRMTVPPGSGNDVSSDGLSQCLVYNVTFEAGSCERDRMNITQTNSTEVIPCTEGWVYDQLDLFTSTIITEWDFVCDMSRKAKAKSIASVFLAGRVVGNFIFGWAADRFGRRNIVLTVGVSSVTVSLVMAFLPDYLSFTILRFFAAVLSTGKTNTAFVMASEFSGPSRRAMVGVLYFTFWTIGLFLLTGVAYVIRPWRHLLLAITVPEYLLYIVFYFVVPESPRWLYANERSEEADKIVRRMAKVNNRELPEGFVIDATVVDHNVTPLDMVRTPNLRRTTIVVSVVWTVIGLVMYTISFSTHMFGSDIFQAMVILTAMELIGAPITVLLMKYTRRIPLMMGTMSLGGICLFISILFSANKGTNLTYTILMSFAKFWTVITFNCIWIYCGECYPTRLRGMGVTITAIGARMSSPLGTYVILLAMYYEHLPSLLLGGLTLVLSLAILLLPETKDRRLAQSITEGERFIGENVLKPICCKREELTSETDTEDSESEMKLQSKFIPEDSANNGELQEKTYFV